jgi:hypothetical protein
MRLKSLNVYDLSEHVRALAATRNGFTVDPESLEAPAKGYAVSLRGYENRTAYAPTHAAVRAWVTDRLEIARMLNLGDGCKVFVGGWWDKGFFYLDVSIVVQGFAQAHALAQQHGQLAFFDLTDKREIQVAMPEAPAPVAV